MIFLDSRSPLPAISREIEESMVHMVVHTYLYDQLHTMRVMRQQMCRFDDHRNYYAICHNEYVVNQRVRKMHHCNTSSKGRVRHSFHAAKYTQHLYYIVSYKQQTTPFINNNISSSTTMKAASAIVVIAASSSAVASVNAFVALPSCRTNNGIINQQPSSSSVLFLSETETESAFVADEPLAENEDKTFDAVEKMGKGAAKIKRGKKKGGGDDTSSFAASAKAAATLTPEETFYEGPPAITETIAPTISILTVVGIVPAAAAWARQAWVRYNITNRRIRVTSGIQGKDMAEIVYPDVVELRTVKRLFGDGDMVFFLRDGAKFEMRNVPNFEETIEFILGNVDKDVKDTYRAQGDVGDN